jgi:hypothetical protein
MISQRYYSILYIQQTVTYTRLYTVSSVYYWHYSATSKISLCGRRLVKSYLKSTMGDKQNIIHKIMEHIYMRIPEGKWSIALNTKQIVKCIHTPWRWINLCGKLMSTIVLWASFFYVVTRKYTNWNHATVLIARQPERKGSIQ